MTSVPHKTPRHHSLRELTKRGHLFPFSHSHLFLLNTSFLQPEGVKLTCWALSRTWRAVAGGGQEASPSVSVSGNSARAVGRLVLVAVVWAAGGPRARLCAGANTRRACQGSCAHVEECAHSFPRPPTHTPHSQDHENRITRSIATAVVRRAVAAAASILGPQDH